MTITHSPATKGSTAKEVDANTVGAAAMTTVGAAVVDMSRTLFILLISFGASRSTHFHNKIEVNYRQIAKSVSHHQAYKHISSSKLHYENQLFNHFLMTVTYNKTELHCSIITKKYTRCTYYLTQYKTNAK